MSNAFGRSHAQVHESLQRWCTVRLAVRSAGVLGMPASVHHLQNGIASGTGMMLRLLAETIIAAAVYGFAIGSVHSGLYAVRNLAKFPLMVLLTGGVCSIAYYLFSQFVSRKLRFRDVQLLALRTFHDVSLLLMDKNSTVLINQGLSHIEPIECD